MTLIRAMQLGVIFSFLVESANAKDSATIYINSIMLFVCVVWAPFFREESRGGK